MIDFCTDRKAVYSELQDVMSLYLKEVAPLLAPVMFSSWPLQGVEPIGLSSKYRRALPQHQIHYGDVRALRVLPHRSTYCQGSAMEGEVDRYIPFTVMVSIMSKYLNQVWRGLSVVM